MKQSQADPTRTPQETQPIYASTREASALLAVSRNTILNWIRAGHLPAARFGKTYRIPRVVIGGFKK
jgi:excisionase family DNA binding protein